MIYYLTFFVALLIAYISTLRKGYDNKWLLMGFMTFFCIWVAIADMLGGYDRYIYGELFDSTALHLMEGTPMFETIVFKHFDGEYGYGLLNVLIAQITINRYIFILLITVLIYFFLYKDFRRYVSNYPIALILFMGLIFFFSFTYLRQVLGYSVAWMSVKYIINRRFMKFLIILLIAMSLHKSAIILFPMYFVPIKKFNETTVIAIGIIILGIGLTGVPSSLFEIYGEMRETDTEIYQADAGFRLAYLVEAVTFITLIFANYRAIPMNKKSIVLLNMAIVFCYILCLFIKSENGGRLGWYYLIGLISTITYISTYSHKITITSIASIAIALFLYMRILLTFWGTQFIPYKTFFTNGHRPGDTTFEKFEYDYMYDVDKFYK